MFVKVLAIGDDVFSAPYLRRKYIDIEDKDLSDYGLEIKKLYLNLVALLDEFRSIRKSRTTGIPGPGSF